MTTGAVLLLVGGAATLTTAVAIRWLRRRILVVVVRGDSMLPSLRHGDVLLARRRPRGIRVGDVAVASWPVAVPEESSPRWLVKRVAATAGDRVPDCVRRAADAVPAEVAAAVAGAAAAPETVPPGHLVVLGDNGGYDSRVFGLLPADRVLAIVARRLSGRDPTPGSPPP
jgi:signal peptidase I